MSLLEGEGATGKYQIDLGFLFKITFKKKNCEIFLTYTGVNVGAIM